MKPDVIQLTKDIVSISSVSHQSNTMVCDLLEETLKKCEFEVERLQFIDQKGEAKISLVAKKGEGKDGFGLFSHSDTVPGDEWAWDAFSPAIEDDRLIGRGSCDMKGPLAATIVAGASVNPSQLKKPLFIIITADEEISGMGARQVTEESVIFNSCRPAHGVIAEPTQLTPVYAHKGGARIVVTAYGKSAHTSTDQGISANFLIAPFLAEMVEVAKLCKTDESFMNHEFDPPTNGFNMILDDGGCKPNVTAAKTICTLGFRPMPDDRSQDIIDMVTEKAKKYDFEVTSNQGQPFYISPETKIVQTGLKATGISKPGTVPFGTDAFSFQDSLELVILGPGNIEQAHTVGEYIEINQLFEAVKVYKKMIEMLCIQ